MNTALSAKRFSLVLLVAVLAAVSATLAARPVLAQEPVVLSVGHTDAVDIHYEDGRLSLRVKDDTVEPTREHDPADVIFQVLPGARTQVPDFPEYAFLGNPGDPIWVLPQSQDPALLWPGWRTESLSQGTFQGNRLQLTLVGVQGPGLVSVFGQNPIGQPIIQWSTHDGLPDTIPVSIPTHAHANWAFGAEGRYTLTFRADATLADGTAVSTGPVDYHFVVGELGQDPEVELAIYGLQDRYEPGDTVTLTAVPTPVVVADSYNWFVNCEGSGPFTQIDGEHGETYTFTATEELDGCRYLAELVADGTSAAQSPPVTLNVEASDPGPGPGGASQTITATVDESEGALVISVNPDDRTVTLPTAQLGPAGDRLQAAGDLRPVTVTDTREARPGWNATGQVSDFSSSGQTGFAGKHLGWTPQVLSQADGQGVAAGAAVAPGFSAGNGIADSSVLGTAPAGSGRGTARLGAGLQLELPTSTPAGTYTATLTLTAI
jgi:surface-anchored protein